MKEDDHNCIDLDRIATQVKEYGHSVVRIASSDYLPSFAYTVGLKETIDHPELICFGLKPELMHNILNDVVDIIKFSGAITTKREFKNIFKDSRATFLEVDKRNISDYFKVAELYYNSSPFDAIQLVWTDPQNLFPWEENFNESFKYKQPLLDRNATFKFRESKNLAVFTTPKWTDEKAPILRVIHDEDGDWQFFTEEVDYDDGKVVSLEQMVRSDKSLNDVFNLEFGESAERAYVGGKWTYES